MKCNVCTHNFPDHLIQPLVSTQGTQAMCPICALKARNKMHGLPEKTPFHGEIAKRYHKEAVQHLRKNGIRV